ncbi:MAG: hypothetical protein ACOZBH_04110 [Patescibacteria group bacterium]
MFEQLFGSKTRAKLIQVFLENPDKVFYVRELTRITGAMINSIRRELQILEEMKIVYVERQMIEQNIKDLNLPEGLNSKKFYKLNTQNVFHRELKNIFKKNNIVNENKITDLLTNISPIHLVVLTGQLIGAADAPTDVLIVTEAPKAKFVPFLKSLKEKVKNELNYTFMTADEYVLRGDIKDKFLFSILNNKKNIVLIDKIKELIATPVAK